MGLVLKMWVIGGQETDSNRSNDSATRTGTRAGKQPVESKGNNWNYYEREVGIVSPDFTQLP
jgi:hypothetical protein